MSGEKQKQTRFSVGARLAREKRPDNAFIQTACVIVDVHRQQAGSYKGNACVFGTYTINCRSWLAGDSGGSVTLLFDWADAIASKQAPTREMQMCLDKYDQQ
ncbi:hypothetical protein J2Y74_002163 [Pseudomonas migulae]|uniref:hypothetical protein n=1 Tax=Pseudomonas migulae TaxID=78543 RepID=UPI0020A1F4A2|nr:hypothetical protein [Pseudomonas migulae]MCP1517853.1 hypothetical protein [Pseudomonas migulae]